ncbi:ABC transporter ATP-binding protein [candidate division FCPU426 bacterium]|nr:ABC transporter ATP-binding protein [candidate division FCPU426 bacterium]
MDDSPVLCLKKVEVSFPRSGNKSLEVLRGVDFQTWPGKTLGLVGESGSGKTMTALSIMGLIPYPGSIHGSIQYQGRELVGLGESEYEKIRGEGISIVFQDPSTALNPVFNIEQQLVETILTHKRISPEKAGISALNALKQVEIPGPEKRIKDYPHQLSGGMKQRVLIAMALVCEPDMLILDEPTTALDVTVQAQILDLIERIQSFNNMSIILISHDIGIVSEISDEVAIMYAGRIVEKGPTNNILAKPKHPYTAGLLKSIPKLGVNKQKLDAIDGFPPNPSDFPSGCPFHPRCPNVKERCKKEDPPDFHDNTHFYACWNKVE